MRNNSERAQTKQKNRFITLSSDSIDADVIDKLIELVDEHGRASDTDALIKWLETKKETDKETDK